MLCLFWVTQSPLFFVRGGGVFPGGILPGDPNHFYNAGEIGYYWSSRTLSDTLIAYGLVFDASIIPSFARENYRYNGFSLRCLIPTT